MQFQNWSPFSAFRTPEEPCRYSRKCGSRSLYAAGAAQTRARHGDGHETPCPCEVCECEAPPTTPPEEDCTPVFQRGLLRRLFKR